MKRYLIEKAKCGVSEGGMACGPVGGNVVATIRYRDPDSSKSMWLSAVEAEGMPNCYIHDWDPYDKLIEEDLNGDKEFWDDLEGHYIEEFDGIGVTDYYDILNEFLDQPDNTSAQFLRYMVTLLRCDMGDIDDLVEIATGRFVDELDIPASDIEEEHFEELAEEEEE